MAVKTQQQWKQDIDRDINTNGTQAITGAIHNQRLNDLADSVLWGAAKRGSKVAVDARGTVVNFTTASATTNFIILVRCYNAAGEAIGYTIDPTRLTVNGFHILPAQTGFIDYLIIA